MSLPGQTLVIMLMDFMSAQVPILFLKAEKERGRILKVLY